MTMNTSGKMSGDFRFETTEIDPALLDRWADALIQQGFVKQAERLSVIAAEMRETTR